MIMLFFETKCWETTWYPWYPKLGSHQHWAELVIKKTTKQSVSNIVNTDCAYATYAHISYMLMRYPYSNHFSTDFSLPVLFYFIFVHLFSLLHGIAMQLFTLFHLLHIASFLLFIRNILNSNHMLQNCSRCLVPRANTACMLCPSPPKSLMTTLTRTGPRMGDRISLVKLF